MKGVVWLCQTSLYLKVASLLQGGFQVDVVAYGGSQPTKEVLTSNISLHLLPEQYVPLFHA